VRGAADGSMQARFMPLWGGISFNVEVPAAPLAPAWRQLSAEKSRTLPRHLTPSPR
jgi:hypothetical protein